jgi:hypothetical protein
VSVLLADRTVAAILLAEQKLGAVPQEFLQVLVLRRRHCVYGAVRVVVVWVWRKQSENQYTIVNVARALAARRMEYSLFTDTSHFTALGSRISNGHRNDRGARTGDIGLCIHVMLEPRDCGCSVCAVQGLMPHQSPFHYSSS